MANAMRVALAIGILWAFSTQPAHANEGVNGTAFVIDGDTIVIHGQRIRLRGIDAPESKQLCYLGGKP